ncbi:unnamed protein product [Brassica oleracea var. botrytis]
MSGALASPIQIAESLASVKPEPAHLAKHVKCSEVPDSVSGLCPRIRYHLEKARVL